MEVNLNLLQRFNLEYDFTLKQKNNQESILAF